MSTMQKSLEVRQAIEKYIKFDISATALRLTLGTSLSFERNESNFALVGGTDMCEPVTVGVDHVLHAIDLALRGSIAFDTLQEWANFILLCDECELAPYLHDVTRQHLTTLIHGLASPEIFGELTRQKLQEIKKELVALCLG
ncbi:MAG: hypothetical protein M3P06_20110 [Acidobacteriota bacterium]|nr:hypothetical protein [Acidobacteriota bacterium]